MLFTPSYWTQLKRWQDGRATIYLLSKDQYYSIYWESPKRANCYDIDLVYCHVATPTVYCQSQLEYTDLDLDVIMWNDGHYVLDDDDEFKQNTQRWSYPDDIVQKAQGAAAWLMQQAAERKPPFGFLRLEEVLAHYVGR